MKNKFSVLSSQCAVFLALTCVSLADPPTATLAPVTISGDQTIAGTKNFTGTVQVAGVALGTAATSASTAFAPAAGSSSITTLGTIATGIWHGTAVADSYIASASTWNAKESALTFSTGLTRSTNTITVNAVNLAASGSGGVTGTLPIANGGTGTTTPALVNGTRISITGTWPNQTINVSGLVSTDVSYTRSGTGMAARTVGAEVDETALTSKAAAAAVNGSDDDTTALQRLADSKQLVRFSMGVSIVSDYLRLKTIGQVIEGAGVSNGTNGSLLTQTTSGADGIHWHTADVADTLPAGGGGAYFLSLRDFSLRTTHANTGIALDLGEDASHSGDYLRLSNLHLMGGWQTGVHIKSMANSLLEGIYYHGDSGSPGDYGYHLEGGSDNSHILMGVSADNVGIGLSLDGPGTFTVFPWDMGLNATNITVAAGANTIIVGGNLGEGYTDRCINLATNSNTVAIQPFLSKSAQETNEPILIGASANFIYIGKTGTLGDGTGGTSGAMQFKGSGFVSLTSTDGVDTLGSIHAETFHQSVFKSVFTDGLLTPGASYRGAINQVIGLSGASEDGISFVKRKADGSTYLLDYLDNSKLLAQANTWIQPQTIDAGYYLQLPSASGGRGGALLWDSVSGWGASRRWWAKTNTSSGGELVFKRSITDATTDPSEDIFGADQAGTLQAYKGLTVTGLVHLVPQVAPGSPAEGDIYADSGDHHLYFYNGTAWKQLDN